jgi:hypothetical protein
VFCVQEGSDQLVVSTMPFVLGRVRSEGVAEFGCPSVTGLLHFGSVGAGLVRVALKQAPCEVNKWPKPITTPDPLCDFGRDSDL